MRKSHGKGWKIGLIALVCLGVVGGGIGAATAPTWAGSSIASESQSPARTTEGLAAPVVQAMELGVTPTDGAAQVNPAAPVVVKATYGTIKSVALTEAKSGTAVEGATSADGSTWTAGGALKFDTAYQYEYTVVDGAGREKHQAQTFTTVPASHEADAAVYPQNGQKVGVGQPLQITFSEPVINKEAVEKALKITTTAGQVGAFHWYSDTMVRYRPEGFWTANSTITMEMALFGVDLGKGQIGNFNKTVTVRIGDKKVMVADSANHVADVYVNDQPSQHFLVTMGDERFPSASGYLVLMDRQRTAHFVAASIGLKPGDPANYGELDVNYATRLTPSGEFIHQATDSAVAYIGQLNLSHGCIGMDEAGASWVFNNMGVGDLVQVINSVGESAAPTDGYGDWNIPWAQYASR
ncbi:Ig-like domain-containing protein [Paenarthrobacter sp. PH39-S1]|uniref:L,D-transpeptidase n=1 Tax=Paenarthrobacter sp. PH39-S1 TaxID=3046204 RepID=UPI0024BA9A92|nr:Ig-like domain-containing protein [Paenarthrobacter sp. PH39-S1]MDJ0356151.1 Ig-like domain-containing protein [Paenarthrobacter sp. PH39-S1]